MSSPSPFDPDYAATVSAELVMVIAQAGTTAEDGETGEPLRELLTHARDLYDILSEQLAAAGPEEMEYARDLAEALGNKLDELDGIARPSLSHPPF